jgi:hypothetical protein
MFLREVQGVLRCDQILASDQSSREIASLYVVDDGSFGDPDESGEV